jgi:hypothetical protein
MKNNLKVNEPFSEAERAYYQAAVDAGFASGFEEVEIEDILPNLKKRAALSRFVRHPGEGRDKA